MILRKNLLQNLHKVVVPYSHMKLNLTDYLELKPRYLQFVRSSTDIFYMPPGLQTPGLETVMTELSQS